MKTAHSVGFYYCHRTAREDWNEGLRDREAWLELDLLRGEGGDVLVETTELLSPIYMYLPRDHVRRDKEYLGSVPDMDMISWGTKEGLYVDLGRPV